MNVTTYLRLLIGANCTKALEPIDVMPIRIMDLMQSKQGLNGALLALGMIPKVDKEHTATK